MKTKIFSTLGIISWVSVSPLVQAESGTKLFPKQLVTLPDNLSIQINKQNYRNNNNPLIYISRPEVGKNSSPGNQVPGGKHGGKCPSVKPPLTALVPGDGKNSFLFLTAQERPNFWLYNPYSSILSAEFLLINRKTKVPVHKETYHLSGKPGIISITLPSTSKGIEVGNEYYWSFQVICSKEDRSADVFVDGYVKRVQRTPNPALKKDIAPEQKAVLYAKDGLWSDTLTTIIKEVHPQNSQQATSLMKDLFKTYPTLIKYTNKNIIPCCTAVKDRSYGGIIPVAHH